MTDAGAPHGPLSDVHPEEGVTPIQSQHSHDLIPSSTAASSSSSSSSSTSTVVPHDGSHHDLHLASDGLLAEVVSVVHHDLITDDSNLVPEQRARRPRRARRGALCELPGCSKRASFGDNVKRYRWCAQHKLPGSHSFQSSFCEENGCEKHASYTFDGIKKRWCAAHKPAGAYIKGAALCEAAQCGTQATFGMPGDRRRWCSEHKREGAVNLSKRTCCVPSCGTRALYMHGTTHRKYCAMHAPEDCRELKSRGQKSAAELQEQLAYVEAENNLLRQRLKRLRGLCDAETLREFDRLERVQGERTRSDQSLGGHAMTKVPRIDTHDGVPAGVHHHAIHLAGLHAQDMHHRALETGGEPGGEDDPHEHHMHHHEHHEHHTDLEHLHHHAHQTHINDHGQAQVQRDQSPQEHLQNSAPGIPTISVVEDESSGAVGRDHGQVAPYDDHFFE